MFAMYPNAKPDKLTFSAYVDATAVLTAQELALEIEQSVARSPTFPPTAAELVYGRLEVGNSHNTHLTAEECARDRLHHQRQKVRARREALIELQCGNNAEMLAVLDGIGKRL
jgi:hypothetical protein